MNCKISRAHQRKGNTVLLGRCFWRSDSTESEKSSRPIDVIDTQDCLDQIKSLLQDLTGSYSFITSIDSGYVASVDQIQSIPLYYSLCDGELVVSDQQQYVRQQVELDERDPASVEEYRTLGFVTGPHTLYPSIKQIEAGTLIHFNENEICRVRHFNYQYASGGKKTQDELDQVIRKIFSRLIELADGRPIWVPLSGGLDSRLIISILKRMNYDNLHAYSYGAKENAESNVSKRVAESLGIDWHFVEYTHSRWRSWYLSEDRKRYDYNLELTITPHLREWPAVKKLRERDVLSDEAIIVPGHTGDMVSGGHLLPHISNSNSLSSEQIENTILSQYYEWNRDISDEKALRKRLRNHYIPDGSVSGEEASQVIERWDWSERQAKHITNHVRPYDFWEVEWWMPFWDAEFIDFWLGVPLEQRLGKEFYDQYVVSVYTDAAEDPIQTVDSEDSITDRIRKYVGESSIRPLVEPVYYSYKDFVREKAWFADETAWNRPLCRHGVMKREKFSEHFNGDHNFRSYRARERLGEISFD